MGTRPGQGRVLSLLRGDLLRHIVTLKMLHLGGDLMECRLLEEEDGWALLCILPTKAFEYDRQTYAGSDWVVLVDGTSTRAKLKLLEELPRGALVIKTYDDAVREFLVVNRKATLARSFVSFTGPAGAPRPPSGPRVAQSEELERSVASMFAANGYMDSELARHFSDGARWFGIRRDGRLVTACFLFRNFETVWEIGGVYTEPACRRRGLARRAVAAAIDHLKKSGRIPRYQVRSDNAASIALAKAAGLEEFLRMDHYVISN